jgi:hypothetical protein
LPRPAGRSAVGRHAEARLSPPEDAVDRRAFLRAAREVDARSIARCSKPVDVKRRE